MCLLVYMMLIAVDITEFITEFNIPQTGKIGKTL